MNSSFQLAYFSLNRTCSVQCFSHLETFSVASAYFRLRFSSFDPAFLYIWVMLVPSHAKCSGQSILAAGVQCATNIIVGSIIGELDQFKTKIVNGRFGPASQIPLATMAIQVYIKFTSNADVFHHVEPCCGTLPITGACVLAGITIILVTRHPTDSFGCSLT